MKDIAATNKSTMQHSMGEGGLCYGENCCTGRRMKRRPLMGATRTN